MGWTTPLAPISDLRPARQPAIARRPGAMFAPDLPLVRAVLQALMAAGPQALSHGWRLGAAGAVHTQRVGGQSITLCLEAGSPELAEQALAALSPAILDAAALLIAWGAPNAGVMTRIVRVTDIIQAKGSRRFGDERRQLVRRISEELQALRRLSVAGGELLFDLTPIDADHEAFVYQPGAWLKAPAPGRCELRPRLLQLDHRPNRGADVLAKKLGLYFSMIATGDAPVVREVGAVLRAIGAASPDLASRRGRGGRLAERFDEALLRLAEQELFTARYRGSDGSGWEDDRGKGRVRRWAAAELIVRRIAPAVRRDVN